ncbi:AAA family ATPase [Nesterenkonia sp. AY15]|uniref:ATP-dependent nuclease n=1 Tax=Nesterenkonia sp. AY15 TaxID=2901139 RepID=UPI001F4CFCD0|nr:AAA family ATPase [Nesterenkonia sp. AY15]MCH8572196.1 AAA family ATPase [Nesterenkonia sp. AY15]
METLRADLVKGAGEHFNMSVQPDTTNDGQTTAPQDRGLVQHLYLENFRRFKKADIKFQTGLNLLVGTNDQGKSTVVEAINLALSGRWQGRHFATELNPHFINDEATAEYLETLRKRPSNPPDPPVIVVDLYLKATKETQHLTGDNNAEARMAPGIRLRAALDKELRAEYRAYLKNTSSVRRVPTEFYKVEWTGFHGIPINPRAVPVRAAIIDASRIRLQSGTDYYLKQIVAEALEQGERTKLSAGYRGAQESFVEDQAIVAINAALNDKRGEITKKRLTLDVDSSQNNQWDNALTPHLDDVPFSMLGSGEQSKLKIMLALARKAGEVGVVLIEEPENHLAFGELNRLIRHIQDHCDEHQLILATHSSFVINKLGLSNLLLLGDTGVHSLTSLPPSTSDYFAKLAGYDTLRLVLAKKVILVEGPSDELIVQKAYRDRFKTLPIEDGIDVINVRGLSAPRFLDLARPLGRPCVVVTDNDGDYEAVKKRYENYEQEAFLSVCIGYGNNFKTLEPQLVHSNGYEKLERMLGKTFGSDEDVCKWMQDNKNKTEAALRLFNSNEMLTLPKYLSEAIDAIAS